MFGGSPASAVGATGRWRRRRSMHRGTPRHSARVCRLEPLESRTVLSVGVLPLTAPALTVDAAVAPLVAFLKIDGIDGDSTDAKHVGWISVLGYSEAVSHPGSLTTRGPVVGKPTFGDFQVVKSVDKTTPILFLDAAAGKHLNGATLEVVEPDGSLLDYKLSDIIIRSVGDRGNLGDATPLEGISLNFAKIEWDYSAANPDGSLQKPVSTGWDLKTQKFQVSGVNAADLQPAASSPQLAPNQGAFSAYLKLDGIPGTSLDERHQDWIEVLGFSWGLSRTGAGTGGGGGAGKVSFSDLSLVKTVDKTTPILFLDSAAGKHLKGATLEVVEPDGSVLDYKLSDVVIRSVGDRGNAGDAAPLERFSLNFAKVEWDYAAANPDGGLQSPVTTVWDLKTHKSQVSSATAAESAALVSAQQLPAGDKSFSAYLKLDGIQGTSLEEPHKDWIEVMGFSWGLSQAGSSAGGGGGAGKVSFSDLSLVKTVDKTTPILFLDSAAGKHLKGATLEVVEPDGSLLDYKLSDVVIRSVGDRGNAGDATPLERFSLNFAKVEWDYAAANSDGSLQKPVTTVWDLKAHKSQVSGAIAADSAALLSAQQPPAVDKPFSAYLKLDGIQGTSLDEPHKDWIEVLGFSWGLSQTGSSAGGGGAGKVSFSDLSLVKTVDKTTPILFLDSAAGKHLKGATLEVVEPDGSLLDYKLSDVVIRSIGDQGNAGDATPLERFSLNFAKVEWDFAAANPDGGLQKPVTTVWDLKTHKSQVSSASAADSAALQSAQQLPAGDTPFSAYLKLDGIQGTSLEEPHKDWIEVLGFSWGLSQTGASAGGGGGAGKVSFSDLSLVKTVDKTTPILFLDSVAGKHIKGGTLEVVEPDGSLLDYKLSDVVIRSVGDQGNAGDATPLERFSLNFAKVEWHYAASNPDGSLQKPVITVWDLKTHKSQVSSATAAESAALVSAQQLPAGNKPFSAYLKLDGIQGTSLDEPHKDWIEVLGFSWGLSRTGSSTGGGGGAGKVSFSDLSLVKTVDKTTPILFLDAAAGKHIKGGTLEVVEPDGSVLDYKLSDVVIRSVGDRGDAGDAAPLERFSLNFTKIEWDYSKVNTGGVLENLAGASWALKPRSALVPSAAVMAAYPVVSATAGATDAVFGNSGVFWQSDERRGN